MQFEIIAERNWDPRSQAEEILLVLKDEATICASSYRMTQGARFDFYPNIWKEDLEI